MFKPYFGICQEGNHKALIVINKPHLCHYHNRLRKGQEVIKKFARPPKPIKKKFPKPTGEKALFIKIWADRPHVSEVSGKYLGDEIDIRFFSHILAKGAYPKFRLNPDNIMLKTVEEHHAWEFGNTSHAVWDKVKKKKEELKFQYYNP